MTMGLCQMSSVNYSENISFFSFMMWDILGKCDLFKEIN